MIRSNEEGRKGQIPTPCVLISQHAAVKVKYYAVLKRDGQDPFRCYA